MDTPPLEKKFTFRRGPAAPRGYITPTLNMSKPFLSLWMRPKFYTGGLTVQDGRLVNERIGDGMTGIGMACQVSKAKKTAEKEAMISRAIMAAEASEYSLGMKKED